jgi:hypothetical protein
MSHSVDFSGNSLYFQLLNLDISSALAIDPSFMELFFVPGFSGYNATATMNVPVDKFSKLFWVNVKFQDLVDNSYNDLKYAMDPSGWNGGSAVAFSSALVTKSESINPLIDITKQQIKQDIVRFFLKEITGSTNMNSIFRNKNQLVQGVVNMDISFQDKITNVLTNSGGTFASPLDNSSQNPVHIMMNSILGEDDDGVDNFNDQRKATLINYFKNTLNTMYANTKGGKYYAYGNAEDGLGWYYPLYIDASHVDLSGVAYHTHQFNGASMLAATGVNYRAVAPGPLGNVISVRHQVGGLGILRFDENNSLRNNYRMMCRVDTDDNQIAFNTIIGETGYTDTDMSGVANWYSGAFDFSGYYHHHFAGQPMQAESMNEFGMALGLAGKSGKKINSVKLVFDTWYTAKYAAWSSDPRYSSSSSGFVVPVTLNFYRMDADGETGNKLGTITSNITMDWAPSYRGPSPTGDGYNGWAFSRTVDVSGLNMVVPSSENVIMTIVYNTQSYGPNPIGSDGPYNALNIGMMEKVEAGVTYGVSAGSLPKDTGFYVNSSSTGFYADNCVNVPLRAIRVDNSIFVVGGNNGSGQSTSTGTLVAAGVMSKASDIVVAVGNETVIETMAKTNLSGGSSAYVGMTFYMPNNNVHHAVNPKPTFDASYTDYSIVDSSFIPIPFYYGDQLSVKLTYHPKTTSISGKTIGSRSYRINMNMGVESVTSVPYNPAGNGDGPLIVGYDNTLGMNYAQSNGINKGFLYLIWNGLTTPTPNPFVSPVNYYPTIGDISNVQMQTFCSPSESAANNSWFWTLYTRPRPNGGASWYGTRVTGIAKAGPGNTWTKFDFSNTSFLNNFSSLGNWQGVLEHPIGVTTTYNGYVETCSQEQLLGFAISTDSSTPTFTGKVADVIVTFKDGRIMKFV